MYRNPNYQKEYHKKYSISERGKKIKEDCNKKYYQTEKFKETRKKYIKNNKEKIKKSNSNYYYRVTKYKLKNKPIVRKPKKNKIPDKPRVEIINKPIILSFF